MLVIIRKEEKISQKTDFIIQLLGLNSQSILYIFKRESKRFIEKWENGKIELPSSARGLIIYYMLAILKSPKDFRNGLMSRLSLAKTKHPFVKEGFLSVLSQVLYQYVAFSPRADRLMRYLEKLDQPMVFLIDEYVSLNCLDLKKLKRLGSIIFVSQDIAHNRFGYADNFVTRQLMYRMERNSLAHIDLVVACSEMEQLRYLEMGAKKAIFYPNLYPTKEFEPADKDQMPSISIVLREHWGSRGEQSLNLILKALAHLDRKIKVHIIGIKPQKVPDNIMLEHSRFIPIKKNYLEILSKSWFGINVGIHKSGTNERKYDYAEAGTIVLSDSLGARGDLLPHEYTYIDSYDLAAKIKQLLEFDKIRIIKMGKENRKHALYMAKLKRKKLLKTLAT
jgi:hypothetical protein